ncbi:unnamed protein product [Hermetia illucens]|uniref:Cytochrome P450 n=1 Tax=Hermetia illucens TaxID=343691 RepID=A0A7R8Z0F2_HERIL|nr:unnamed protein product [Hermetia illucens]
MAFLLLTLSLVGLIGTLLYLFLTFNFNYWKKRGVLGPKPRLLLGNIPNIVLRKRNFQYDIIDIYREYKGKDRFVGIFNVRNPQLLIIDPKLVQDVLIANFRNFSENEFSKWADKETDPLLGRNPFILSGNEWKEKRGEVTPALTNNRIKASYPIMLSVCGKMTKYLEKETKKHIADGIEARELAARYTTEVVSNCIYGIEAGAFEEGTCEIREKGAAVLDQSFASIVYLMLMSAVPDCLRGIFKRPFMRKDMQTYFIQLMKEAIRVRQSTKSDRVDFLNYLLQLREKKNLSEIEVAAHTITFFVDGFETSSILISNCIRCLAQHESAQQKLRDEINKTIEENGEVSFENLQELPYLDQCINECLRLYPPAIASNKMCSNACELMSSKDKPIKIEKGTPILLPYYALHHDPEYYPNPEAFIPERFSPENGGAKKYKEMGVFLPFGDGPRICLGMRFALCQSKAAVVEIIRNWKVKLNPRTNPNFIIDTQHFLCVPEGGSWLAQHESAQQKFRDEINKTIEENGEMSFENLQELPYLDQCINECLQLYPPAIASNKMCSNSKEKPIKIEKGTPS